MLVLARKVNESVIIDNAEITVTVLEVRGGKVRLGFECGLRHHVHLREVWEALKQAEPAEHRETTRQAKMPRTKGVGADAHTHAADEAHQPDRSGGESPTPDPMAEDVRIGGPENEREELKAALERLTRERDQMSEKYHRVLDDLISAKRQLFGLRDAVADSDKNKVRMIEYYEGAVRHRDMHEVVVAYEVENDLVEQTYQRDQFIDGKMPDLGEQLSVFVRVASVVPDGRVDIDDEGEWFDDHGEPLAREF
ncbi:MAG: carbon storage regulator [Isosphaeraceae bacterium]